MSDWIDEVKEDGVLSEVVKSQIEKLRELKFKMDMAEAAFENAKNIYAKEVESTSQALKMSGLQSLKLQDGSELKVVEKARCSIAKDENKKREVADWLEEQGMENLVSSQLILLPSPSTVALLEQNHIPYDKSVSMNTNSVKAYVKGELELGNLSLSSLPSGLSFYPYNDIVWG